MRILTVLKHQMKSIMRTRTPLLTMLLMSPLILMNPLAGGKSMTEPLVSLVSSTLNHILIYQSVPLSSNLLWPSFSLLYTESDNEYLKEIAKESRSTRR
jgi:hypothetical protein